MKKKYIDLLIIIALFVVVSVLKSVGLINNYAMQLIMLACINIIMTISLNLVNGFTGQFSIGHAGFMAVGAYGSAVITTLLFKTSGWALAAQVPIYLISLLAGGLLAALMGLLIGIPSLRLKGDYLAIVTLGFGELLRSIIRLIDYVGGPRGLTGIPSYTNFFWVFLFTIISIYVARNLVYSSVGRSCISVRDNEIAAEAMGIDTTRVKVQIFTIASFIAGVAGGLYAHMFMYLQPDTFNFSKSTDFLVFLYAGGAGSISGSILSAAALTVVPELLRFLENWRMVIYGFVLVFLMLRRPQGIMGGKEFGFIGKRNPVLGKTQKTSS